MTRPIREVWVWKIPLTLMVNAVQESVHVKVTKYIKRCCTLATIFHPEVLNLPFLSQLKEQAKLSIITAHKYILISDPGFIFRNEIPQNTQSVLNAAYF